MIPPERTLLLTLNCAGRKTHTLAEIIREDGTDYIEAKQLHGGYLPDGLNAQGQPIDNVKGTPGRYELLTGEAAQRAATRFRCSCGTTLLVADMTFRDALAEHVTKLVSDRVPEAELMLDGHNVSPELTRIVLADTAANPVTGPQEP